MTYANILCYYKHTSYNRFSLYDIINEKRDLKLQHKLLLGLIWLPEKKTIAYIIECSMVLLTTRLVFCFPKLVTYGNSAFIRISIWTLEHGAWMKAFRGLIVTYTVVNYIVT